MAGALLRSHLRAGELPRTHFNTLSPTQIFDGVFRFALSLSQHFTLRNTFAVVVLSSVV